MPLFFNYTLLYLISMQETYFTEKELEAKTYLDNKFSNFYDTFIQNSMQVFEVFEEYFGKDKVDLQIPKKEAVIEMLYAHQFKYKDSSYNRKSIFKEEVYRYPLEIVMKYSKEVFEEVFNEFSNNFTELNILINDFNINFSIIVYYPNVTVTNEYNDSIEIQKVFITIPLYYDGRYKNTFKIVRSEYTLEQFAAKYMFSHTPRINYDSIYIPSSPCLGSGPIVKTISSLKIECDLDLWRLFCIELNNYIHNESISGGPYIQMRDVHIRGYNTPINYDYNIVTPVNFSWLLEVDIKEFIKYILKKKILKFNYSKGCFSIALDPNKYLIIISNLFIEWYIDLYAKGVYYKSYNEILNSQILKKVAYKDNKFYYTKKDTINIEELLHYVGTPIIKFKGIIHTLKITNVVDTKEGTVTVLNPQLLSYITSKILKIVNYVYTTGFNSDYSQTKFLL